MTTKDVKTQLIDKLEQELTREKTVSGNQLLGISRHYSIADFDQLKAMIDQKTRDGSDLDLFMILSYNFTPDIRDRALFSSLLDHLTLSTGDVEEMTRIFTEKKLKATLGWAGYSAKIQVPLVEAVIARYVRNLHLNAPLEDRLRKVIGELVAEKDHALVKAIFRDEVWQKSPWQDNAVAVLYALSRKQFRVEKLTYLTTFITSNQPKNMTGLVRLMKEVIEAYATEVRRLEKGAKMFFNEMLRESYDGSEADQRDKEAEKLEDQRRQLAVSMELAEDLKNVS